MDRFDVLIIGAGPSGLSAGIYAKRANLSVVVFEKSTPGGKVNTATKIENYAGIASISGPELAFQIYEHAMNMGVNIKSEEILSIDRKDNYFLVSTLKNTYEAYSIIIASGLSNKKMQLKNESTFEGRGVSYCATCDGNFFKNKNVAVIGNDDIAINEAMYLANLCSKVYCLTKQIDKYDLEKLNKFSNIEVIDNSKALAINGENSVSSLVYLKDEKEHEIEVKGVFPLGEEVTNLRFLLNLGVQIEKNFIVVDKNMATNVKGVFASGDVTNNPLKQIVTAAGDGAVAATSAIKYVREIKR